MATSPHKLMLLGAPGAGKGTVAKGLVANLGIAHLSTGDMLRAAVTAGTEVGKLAKGFMDAGQLVPDDVMVALIGERTAEADCKGPGGTARFLLDGFPRTLPQADALDAGGLAPEIVIYVDVPEGDLLSRLTGRRSCPSCGAPFHVDFQPPKAAGVCDACGTALVHRTDDQEGAIRKRLAAYSAQTAPLVKRYGDIVVRIDGTQRPAAVLQDVLSAIGAAGKQDGQRASGVLLGAA